jgi:hypothetical protein
MRTRALTVALALLAAGCGDEDEPAATTSTSTTTTTTTATTTTSTTAAPTTTTTLPLPAAPRPTPREAVDAFLGSWRFGDRAGALAVAEPDAVEVLFAVPPEAPEDRGCNEPPPGSPTACVFRLAAGELQVRTAEIPGGFIVDFAILSPH